MLFGPKKYIYLSVGFQNSRRIYAYRINATGMQLYKKLKLSKQREKGVDHSI